jgi:heat shock protein HtpX
MLLVLVLMLLLARVGGAFFLSEHLGRLGVLIGSMIRGLHRPAAAEFSVPLDPDTAPGLFVLLRELSARLELPLPRRVRLEHSSNAWARLGGLLRGSGRYEVGIGFLLLVILEPDEVAAVVAHELAHARLVQRGLHRLVGTGVARLCAVTDDLRELIEEVSRTERGRTPQGAQMLFGLLTPLAARACALHALGSRSQEFAADRLAASLAGAEPLRRALRKIRSMASAPWQPRGRDWNARLHSDDDFATWLRREYENALSAEAVEDAAGPEAPISRFSTHPPMPERLAALAEVASTTAVSIPKEPLLREPRRLAGHLLEQTDATLCRLERRAERLARRWFGETYAPYRHDIWTRAAFAWGVLLSLPLIAMVVMLLLSGSRLNAADVGGFSLLFLVAAGPALVIYPLSRLGLRRYPPEWPVPSPAAFWSSAERDEVTEAGPEGPSLEAAPSNLEGAPALARHWGETARAALTSGDMRRALHSGLEALSHHPTEPNGLAAVAVAGAHSGLEQHAQSALVQYLRRHRRAPGAIWIAAWYFFEQGEPALAEGGVLNVLDRCTGRRRRKPVPSHSLATVWLMLARLREAREAYLTGLAAASEAVKLAPDEPAGHRCRLRLLFELGRVAEAEAELDWLQQRIPDDREVLRGRVRACLLRDRAAEAERCANAYLQCHSGPIELVHLADVASEERDELHARWLLQQAASKGHVPAALIRMAGLEARAGREEQVRGLVAAALDPRREATVGPAATALLPAALSLLKQLSPAVDDCQAWSVRLTFPEPVLGAAVWTLGVHAPSIETAAEHVTWLYHALMPGTPLRAEQLLIGPGPAHHRPLATEHPGIYRARCEAAAGHSPTTAPST